MNSQDKEAINYFIKQAKKYSKHFNEDWEYIFADMLSWSLINLIDKYPKYLEELKEIYVADLK